VEKWLKTCLWETTYAGLPHKFEAGTPNVAGGIVLELPSIIWTKLALKIFKTRTWIVRLWNQTLVRNWRFENIWYSKTSVISFNIEGIHPYDIGTIIDKLGIAVRTGHHCAQPIMTFRYSRNNTSFFFFFTIPKKKSTLWLKRWKEQHSCCLNLNDENTIFTTIDCFSWEELRGTKQDLEESAVIEYTANSRGFWKSLFKTKWS
jgi:hypothetical protein